MSKRTKQSKNERKPPNSNDWEVLDTDSRGILPEVEITDLDTIKILMHDLKYRVLSYLIGQEKKIIEIGNDLGKNPGSIKRVIMELLEKGLIFRSSVKQNERSIKMYYYRAIADKFIIKHEIFSSELSDKK